MSSKQYINLVMAVAISSLSSSCLAAAVSKCHRPTYSQDKFDISFNSLVTFGDSFSDVGNIYDASHGDKPSPNFSWSGRYSNGRVWSEYITQFFDLPSLTPSTQGGSDYSWGGATTDDAYIESFSTYLNATVPGVSQQITTYLDDRQQEDYDSSEGNKNLYALFSGYNDYWWYVHLNYTTSQGQELNFTNVYTTVANEVIQNVERLYNDAGARIFLVANVMNMSTWAEAALHPQDVLDSYDILVEGHNSVLSELLSNFEASHTDVTIYNFDVLNSFECLNEQKDYLGIQNVTSPCHPDDDTDCGDIYSYKFWDWYHPTTHGHHVWSIEALQSIWEKEEKKKEEKMLEYRQRKFGHLPPPAAAVEENMQMMGDDESSEHYVRTSYLRKMREMY